MTAERHQIAGMSRPLYDSPSRRGDFVLVSRVPWVSYSWGPYEVGANVLLAPGRDEDAWALGPESVAASVAWCRAETGREVSLLVITSPDNPTGHTLEPGQQLELARAALKAGIPSFHGQAVAIAAYRMGFEKASASIVEPTNRSCGLAGPSRAVLWSSRCAAAGSEREPSERAPAAGRQASGALRSGAVVDC